jgi:hypothetical protein
MTTPGPPGGRDDDVPPKSTLFCPDCEHASPTDGDWQLVRAPRETRYVCPSCSRVVTRRPTDLDADQRGVLGLSVRLWGENLRTVQKGMRSWQSVWREVGSALTLG